MSNPIESALLAQHFTPDELVESRAANRDPWIWRNTVYVRCADCARWTGVCGLGRYVSAPAQVVICNRYQPRGDRHVEI